MPWPEMTKAILWDRVIPEPNTGCWLWEGSCFTRGYGQYKQKSAHRLSYELYFGPIPPGQFVLHFCDQPSCCNPDHLRAGSDADNVRDMFKRGRAAVLDEKHRIYKLNCSQVREIRAAHGSHAKVAKDYGVSPSHVSRIRKGQHWPHVRAATEANRMRCISPSERDNLRGSSPETHS